MPLLVLWIVFVLALTTAPAMCTNPLLALLLNNYDSTTRPLAPPLLSDTVCSSVGPGTQPDIAKVQIAVESMKHVETSKKTYFLDGYLRVWWSDPRLAFGNHTCLEQLTLGPPEFQPSSQIWVPPISIQGSQKYDMIGGASPGEMLRLNRDGSLYWSRKLGVELNCEMNFGRLPYDVQYCLVGVWLYRYKSADVSLEWKYPTQEGALAILNDEGVLHSNEWSATVFKARNYEKHYTSGALSFAQVCLKLERSSFANMLTMVTAIMLVLANYSGLFISAAAIPGRVALAFLSFLMVLNTINHAISLLPPPQIGKRIWLYDFLLGHLIFNFSLLMEFACLNFGLRHGAKEKAKLKKIEEQRMIDTSEDQFEEKNPVVVLTAIGACSDQSSEEHLNRQHAARDANLDVDGNKDDSPFSCYAVMMASIGDHLIKLDRLTRRYFLVAYIIFLIVMFSINGLYSSNEGCW